MKLAAESVSKVCFGVHISDLWSLNVLLVSVVFTTMKITGDMHLFHNIFYLKYLNNNGIINMI